MSHNQCDKRVIVEEADTQQGGGSLRARAATACLTHLRCGALDTGCASATASDQPGEFERRSRRAHATLAPRRVGRKRGNPAPSSHALPDRSQYDIAPRIRVRHAQIFPPWLADSCHHSPRPQRRSPPRDAVRPDGGSWVHRLRDYRHGSLQLPQNEQDTRQPKRSPFRRPYRSLPRQPYSP